MSELVRRWRIVGPLAVLLAILAVPSPAADARSASAPAADPAIHDAVRERLQREGRARVLVTLRLPAGAHLPEGGLAPAVRAAQRADIRLAQQSILGRLKPHSHKILRRYATIPMMALEVGPQALAELAAAPGIVASVVVDPILRPTLLDSVPLVGADQAAASGYDGSGMVVAVIDSGVDSSHPFLAGKVIAEACFSSTEPGISKSVCPNGAEEQIGPGAGQPCTLDECFHGTHVAGIVAGAGDAFGFPMTGVAPAASLVAIQVFSRIEDFTACGGLPPCLGAFGSDLIAGLEHAYSLRESYALAAVNLSLGGDRFTAPCDSEPYKPAIDNLRSAGIASVVASGNAGYTDALASPACVSSAVSVGATSIDDSVAYFSNAAPFLSLLAPGDPILSSLPGGSFFYLSGTSMAAPHVAGAWAVLKQAVPDGSVDQLLAALRDTGRPISDPRTFPPLVTPRIQVFEALSSLVPIEAPVPIVTALSPARAIAGTGAFTLTVQGSRFTRNSVVRWNGGDRPTTFVSATRLEAAIAAADVAAVGTAQVTVFTPPPGGGTSAAIAFPVTPPPVLTVSATTVTTSASVTVTLTNGLGGETDWLALAATGASDGSYLQWTYVGAGVASRTWTVTMPATPGTYEFRLFLANGFTRAATSPTVTVEPPPAPVPSITSLTPNRAFAGSAGFTLSVDGTGFVTSSVVRWNGSDRPTTFVAATRLHAAISAADVASVGTAQVTVFTPAPGGGASNAVPFSIAAPPALSVSATSVPASSSVTVTLTNGLGGANDWLALAATGAPSTSYLQWTYVGGGVTTRTWTVTMPATAGSYEFRLFLANSYTRAATSPPVTVQAGANPAPLIGALTPNRALAGSGAFTLTVDGTGFVASSIVRWNGGDRPTAFVSGTRLTATIAAADVATVGTAQVSVFTPAPGGGTSAALPFTIATAPTLTVSATSVPPSTGVTVTLTNGAGGSTDWLALAPAGAPNSSYLQYTYVGAGVTTRTWTVTMPATPGAYEFRLFLANSYTRAATSPVVTVESSGINPVPVMGALTPNRVFAGSAGFTLTVDGSGFAPGSVVRWNGSDRPTTFVAGTRLLAAIPAADVAVAGTVQVTVFTPAPGGGTSAPAAFTISPPPALGVSATSVGPSASVTVTLTNGPGGATDWLALATVGAPSTNYLQWTYVGAGVTARTWTVTMPATAGTYEFRLFLANGYTRAATSPPVTVGASAP